MQRQPTKPAAVMDDDMPTNPNGEYSIFKKNPSPTKSHKTITYAPQVDEMEGNVKIPFVDNSLTG